mmetsp:Transcript_4126/g.8961  ORF Transcript_4126/g.8961 Transcript_4126/m.8961 type:complete len:390 (-) Transcript_4126:312-1481(-)
MSNCSSKSLFDAQLHRAPNGSPPSLRFNLDKKTYVTSDTRVTATSKPRSRTCSPPSTSSMSMLSSPRSTLQGRTSPRVSPKSMRRTTSCLQTGSYVRLSPLPIGLPASSEASPGPSPRVKCSGMTVLENLSTESALLEAVHALDENERRPAEKISNPIYRNPIYRNAPLAEAIRNWDLKESLRTSTCDTIKCCQRLQKLTQIDGTEMLAANAGALDVLVRVIRKNLRLGEVQQYACHSIGNICVGSNEQSFIRKQLAADAGAVNAIAAAMQTHFLSSAVQEYGCFALGNICFGFDVKANARKDSAPITEIVIAMRTHKDSSAVLRWGCRALGNICCGTDGHAAARRRAATQAGALATVVDAMRAHPSVGSVQLEGQYACSKIVEGRRSS